MYRLSHYNSEDGGHTGYVVNLPEPQDPNKTARCDTFRVPTQSGNVWKFISLFSMFGEFYFL